MPNKLGAHKHTLRKHVSKIEWRFLANTHELGTFLLALQSFVKLTLCSKISIKIIKNLKSFELTLKTYFHVHKCFKLFSIKLKTFQFLSMCQNQYFKDVFQVRSETEICYRVRNLHFIILANQ